MEKQIVTEMYGRFKQYATHTAFIGDIIVKDGQGFERSERGEFIETDYNFTEFQVAWNYANAKGRLQNISHSVNKSIQRGTLRSITG